MADIVLVTGVFDVLHPGHISLLRDVHNLYPDYELVVGINGDRRTKELKPFVLFTAAERKTILEALAVVDRVIVFEEDDPAALIERLRPKIFVKGMDWHGTHMAEEDICRYYGVEIMFMGNQKSHSSSELKRRLHVSS